MVNRKVQLKGPEGLGGFFVPVITPFDSNLELDEGRLVDHIAWLAKRGAEGLVALGSNGEFASLSLEEKLRVLAIVAESGRTRWKLAGVATPSLAEARTLGEAARELGYDGILLLPPHHPRGLQAEGVRAFLEHSIEAAGLPCVLYHHPAQSGCALQTLLEPLAEHPLVVGVKDSSGDAENTCEIRRKYPRIRLWLGGDQRVLEGLRLGAVGSITAAANAVPELVMAVYTAERKSDARGATRAQQRLAKVRELFDGYALPAVAKLMLELRGWPPCPVRPPLLDVDASGCDRIRAAFEEWMPGSRESER